MLVSLNWLKKYIDYGSLSAVQLGELITKSGIEVDGINYVTTEKSENVVVGYVKECEKHPNADKLNLCQVDVGDEQLQIICGAANVAKGQKVVVAKPGAVLPGNFKIKKVNLRGIESNGMICSMQELGVQEEYVLPEFAEGIVVLPDDAEIGTDVRKLLNLDDAILELDLTPNRADALSMLGVAYDVSAIVDKPISYPKPEVDTIDEDINKYVTVDVKDPSLCPYYGAFIIKDVQIKPSPIWMQNYLLAAGIRPINNVVDITNYVLIEYGQPLHAFDYYLLQSKEVVVRAAEQGEEMITLDGKNRVLAEEHLLITNGKEGIALAGVMGGANTEVSHQTNTILLEAALFNPQTVRKTVNATGLRSEASTRFEKGVDPNRVKEAGLRACELLQKYANGVVLEGVAEFNALEVSEKRVNMNRNKVNRRLGTTLSNEEIEDILRRLQFAWTRNDDDYVVSVPSRRGDIVIFEDMLEEIARIFGYDSLPFTLPANSSKPGGLTIQQQLKRRIKTYLQSVGLFETINYSLNDKDSVGKFISPEYKDERLHPVTLRSPMSEAHQYLRQSLLPQLLKSLSYNVARKESNVFLYEIGAVFLSNEQSIQQQPKEHERIAGALTGLWVDHKWQQQLTKVDFYVVKGIVEGLLDYLDMEVTFTPIQLEHMHPGRCATISVDGQIIGFLGQVHPYTAKQMDLNETYVFDLDLEYMLHRTQQDLVFQTIPKYPSIKRDIAFVVDQHVEAGNIKTVIEKIGTPLVKKVDVFDVYVGEHLVDHKKSIAYHIHYQHPNKTLTDEEVDASIQEVIAAVEEQFGAYVRTE